MLLWRKLNSNPHGDHHECTTPWRGADCTNIYKCVDHGIAAEAEEEGGSRGLPGRRQGGRRRLSSLCLSVFVLGTLSLLSDSKRVSYLNLLALCLSFYLQMEARHVKLCAGKL